MSEIDKYKEIDETTPEGKQLMEEIRKRAGVKLIAYGFEEILRQPLKIKRTYTCREIAEELGKHPDTIFEWFKDVPGVIIKKSPAKRIKDPKTVEWRIKHKHTILMIPLDVYMQWVRDHTKKSPS